MKVHRPSRARSHERILTVDDGQVTCPRQGLVAIERCWACRSYDGLSAGYIEGVICGWSASSPIVGRSVDA